ncbi:MAG: Hsp70 family protein [Dolichospermum sp.]
MSGINIGNFVGIDLGTTNSVAAFKLAELEVVTADGNTQPDKKLTKSVVACDQGKIIVGDTAYNQLRADPENVIISIKRLIGRGFGDEVVQQQLSKFAYKVTKLSSGTENSLAVHLDGKEYEPEDISAEIIKKVVENAQKYQQQMGQTGTINQAVITIPAYFNDKQRYATQRAAIKAGLAKPELLPEPTAAAISYGFKPDSDDVKTILVYDFGGGTFDSSIITSTGKDFIESEKAGDLWLGGDDIDHQIMDYVKLQVAEKEGLGDIDSLIQKMPHYQKVRFLGDLKIAVEQAKIQLSKKDSVNIIPSTPLIDDLGMTVYIDVTLSREQFEKMIAPMVERSINICQLAVKESGFELDLVDVVLLVGGSSQIPYVQRQVKQVFGAEKVVVHPRPMYAVAEGAAIVAAGLVEKTSTVSRDYFIKLVDEPRHIIIQRNENLPVTTSHTFKTEADGQGLIHFKFFSPDQVREDLEKKRSEEYIGGMWLALHKPYPKGTELLVTAELDENNGSLQITAALKNDPAVKVSHSFSRGDRDEGISKEVEQLINDLNEEGALTEKGVNKVYEIAGTVVTAANQISDRNGIIQSDRQAIAEAKLQELKAFSSDDYHLANSLIVDFRFIVEVCDQYLTDDQKIRLRRLIEELETAVRTNNLSAIQKLVEDGNKESRNLPEIVNLILACREGVARANQINPSAAKVLSMKFGQMLDAMERGNGSEAERILSEIIPELQHYLGQDLPTMNIATGLTK